MAQDTATTEKGMTSLSTSGSAVVDLFWKTGNRSMEDETINDLMTKAWSESPNLTLKLILHLRDVRNGKGEKKTAFRCFSWVKQNHPDFYRWNLPLFVQVGCYKDLITLFHMNGANDEELLEVDLFAQQLKLDQQILIKEENDDDDKNMEQQNEEEEDQKDKDMDNKDDCDDQKDKDKNKEQENEEEEDQKDKDMDNKDDCDDQKDKDMNIKDQKVKKRTFSQLSLAAKWAPSEKSLLESGRRFAKELRNRLFPPGTSQQWKQYRQFLTRCRTRLQILEQLMCAEQWQNIQFAHVPGRAHRLHSKAFTRHCAEDYNNYLIDVKSHKKTIKSAGNHPHEILKPLCEKLLFAHFGPLHPTEITRIELQWKSMLEELQQNKLLGSFEKTMAVVDVSGSMYSTGSAVRPIDVALTLGFIVSELTNEPFRGKLLTFSNEPQWIEVKGETLQDKLASIFHANWKLNTNLVKTFELILNLAVTFSIKQEDMIQTLFIFSDMQFDAVEYPHGFKYGAKCGSQPENKQTTHQIINEMYMKAGYNVPRLVYWNLNSRDNDIVARMDENGVCLLSGFSPQLLKNVLQTPTQLNPWQIVEKTLQPYQVFLTDPK